MNSATISVVWVLSRILRWCRSQNNQKKILKASYSRDNIHEYFVIDFIDIVNMNAEIVGNDCQCDLHSADCNFLWSVTEIFSFVVS